MQFDYLYQMQATGQLDIEDVGNFALSLTNDMYMEYILIVMTKNGNTKVVQYGPRYIDREDPCSSINYTYNEFQFNMNKIKTIIDKALNGNTLCSQATLISFKEAIERIKEPAEFLYDTER